MGSGVIELQKDSLDRQVPITDLLRKALLIARKLGIAEFKTWVTQELEGYKNTQDIPAYRQIDGTVKAWNPYRGWEPVKFSNNEMDEVFSRRPCGQAIAEIECLLGAEPKSGSLQMPFPTETEQ